VVVTTLSTIISPLTCDSNKAKIAFWDMFDPTLTFWPQNLMHSSLLQSLLVVKMVKFHQQILEILC